MSHTNISHCSSVHQTMPNADVFATSRVLDMVENCSIHRLFECYAQLQRYPASEAFQHHHITTSLIDNVQPDASGSACTSSTNDAVPLTIADVLHIIERALLHKELDEYVEEAPDSEKHDRDQIASACKTAFIQHRRCLNLLNYQHVRKLPKSLSRLQHLEVIYIWGCSSLEVLSAELSRLTKLERITIWGCSALKELSDSFMSVPNLKSFSLGHCAALNYLPYAVVGLKHVNHIIIKDCDAIRISEGVLCDSEQHTLVYATLSQYSTDSTCDNSAPVISNHLPESEAQEESLAVPSAPAGCLLY